ncbi:hypothetical protein [Kineococcus sp. SYSU DK001]|uniref:hypothetical protein n=1 Tax=Kineococcus sp. SYSU DK001 TaxID=3383122 RepID=UPI003D7E99F2
MSDEVPEVDDPDLRAADSSLGDPDDPGNLATDTLEADDQDDTWEPDQHLSNATAGLIRDGDRDEETLSERLAQEEPDVDASRGGELDSDQDYRQV